MRKKRLSETDDELRQLVFRRFDAVVGLVAEDQGRAARIRSAVQALDEAGALESAEVCAALASIAREVRDGWPSASSASSASSAARRAAEWRHEGTRRLRAKAALMASEPTYWRASKAATVRKLLPDLRVYRATLAAAGFVGLPTLDTERTSRTVYEWIRYSGRLEDDGES